MLCLGDSGDLADMEILYAHRMRQMLADKDPVIALIDQDAWAKNFGYSGILAPGVGRSLRAQPPHQCEALRRLKARELQESARHPELDQRVTVGDYVSMMSKHRPNHLEQIERVKKEVIGK